jgi:hypothetical protein
MSNPIWRAFVAQQMKVWLDFFRNHHVDSYIDMMEKFIRLHPYYIPNAEDLGTDSGNLIRRMLWNQDFNDKLSDKGLQVWAASPFSEFIEELTVYNHEYQEITALTAMFSRHSLWFERIYAHLRRKIIDNRDFS